MKKILATLIFVATGALLISVHVPSPPRSMEAAQAANGASCVWQGETGIFFKPEPAPGLRHALLVVSGNAPTLPQLRDSAQRERNRILNAQGLCGANDQKIPIAAGKLPQLGKTRHGIAGGM